MAVRKIKDLYTGYFQKSKVFLYPALGHKKGTSVTPIETYLSWENVININDGKLACLYHLRDDEEFMLFEEKHLFNNPLFEDYKEVSNNRAVYIFNFEDHADDYFNVVEGKYSRLTPELKNMIRDHYGGSTANYAFIDSYLYPDNYYKLYAKFLCPNPKDRKAMKKTLMNVGELCSIPDFNKEMLKMPVMALDLKKI